MLPLLHDEFGFINNSLRRQHLLLKLSWHTNCACILCMLWNLPAQAHPRLGPGSPSPQTRLSPIVMKHLSSAMAVWCITHCTPPPPSLLLLPLPPSLPPSPPSLPSSRVTTLMMMMMVWYYHQQKVAGMLKSEDHTNTRKSNQRFSMLTWT